MGVERVEEGKWVLSNKNKLAVMEGLILACPGSHSKLTYVKKLCRAKSTHTHKHTNKYK